MYRRLHHCTVHNLLLNYVTTTYLNPFLIKFIFSFRIIVEEFYRPMLVAGLLTSDQLAAIFLNADELIQVNAHFSEVNYFQKNVEFKNVYFWNYL